jgi:hypothetical protein
MAQEVVVERSNSAASANAPHVEKFTITGTVIDAVSGEPVRKALVQLNGTTRRATFSDNGGRFQFEGVPAGGVSVTAQKPGYFSEQEMARNGVPPLEVGPNAAPTTLKLYPEAVIFGKVTSSDGVPLEHVSITLTHITIRDGQRHWDNQGNTGTDVEGRFRFANLRPGTYFVAVAPHTPQVESLLETDQSPTTGYRGVYYAGAPDMTSATPLQLAAGQQTEADFSLTEVPVYRVSGTISGYQPNQNVGLQIFDSSGVQVPVGVQFSPDNGRFDVRGLPAGTYALKAFSQLTSTQNVRAEVHFSLSSDLHNLHLALAPATTIPVVVNMEAQTTTGRMRRSANQTYSSPPVSARLLGSGPGSNDAFASVEGQPGQQSLIFRNLEPGRYTARFDPGWPWYVASADYGQTNLLSDDLVITAGAPAQEMRITLRNDSAEIGGTVNVPDGTTAPVTIIAVPQAGAKASPRITSFLPPPDKRRAANGNDFGIGMLAPGEYLVFAFDHIDDVEYLSPEGLESYSSRATHITLSPGQRAKVTLELIRTEGGTN